MSAETHDDVIALMPARRGHFLLESGHHGELWLDLELLCLAPDPVRRLAARLAARLAPYAIEAVCGPLVEGAFVAMMVASELGVPFAYSERFPNPERGGLFAVDYRVPRALRAEVRGRRVAIVNDVINAGSAVRGTLTDLEACAARPVAIGVLLRAGLVGLANRRRPVNRPRDARRASEQHLDARRVPDVRARSPAGQRPRPRPDRRALTSSPEAS